MYLLPPPTNVIREGLRWQLTCAACPEQYDVYKDDKQVAYARLRHGEFYATVEPFQSEIVYEAHPYGDGQFEDHEREEHLVAASKAINRYLRYSTPLKEGTKVRKWTGDYEWEGVVCSAFYTPNDELRYVVGHPVDKGYVLHIYGPHNLKTIP